MTETEHDYQIRKQAEWKPGSAAVGASIRTMRFWVPGIPVAQPRQRHANIGGRIMNYTPKDSPVNAYKALVALAASQERPDGWDASGPMRVELDAWFPRPKGKTLKSRRNAPYPKTGKPDVDNLFKSTADALEGIVWNDDAQVFEAVIKKWVCGDGDDVGVRIFIERTGGPK